MQTRTGAKIFLNQDFPAGVNRQVSIQGTPAQVKAAGDLIKLILEHGPTAIHVNRWDSEVADSGMYTAT